MINKNIGFIGAGNMAEALIKGVIKAGTARASGIIVFDIDLDRMECLKKKYRIKMAGSNSEVCLEADIVILAVKPQQFTEVLREIAPFVDDKQTVISIAAGVRIAKLEKAFEQDIAVIRVMPNTPALVGQGMTVVSRGKLAGKTHEATAVQIFESVGDVLCLPESKLDAVTALSGSGPAYFFFMLECLQEAGAKLGLSQDTAMTLAKQTALGASALAMDSMDTPEVLRQKVTSKGGTTEAALKVLKKKKFKQAVAEALKAAYKRSKQLGK